MRGVVGGEDVVAQRGAAGVGMFDDDAGGVFGEAQHGLQGGVGVGEVVVGEFFALDLFGGGERRACRLAAGVEGRLLVRVFAVAQDAVQLVVGVVVLREAVRLRAKARGEVVGDGTVVVGGVVEGFGHQALAQFEVKGAALNGGDDFGVVGRADDDADGFVVFRRRAHERRAADVDVFHRFFQGNARLVDGFAEGVEVDDDEVNRRDVVFVHHRVVGAATTEDAAVDFRMQGFDAPGHDFGEGGVLADVFDGNAGIAQRLRRAAGGEDFDATGDEAGGKFDEAAFVGYADERAARGYGMGHGGLR